MKAKPPVTPLAKHKLQIKDIREELDEAQETLRAIRHGEVDALVVNSKLGHQIFTLKNPDHPDLSDFIMQAPAPMVYIGAENRFIVANHAYEHMVGRKVTGKTVREALSENEVGNFLVLLDKVYLSGTTFIDKDLPLNIPDENGVIEEKYVDVGYHAFRVPDGKIKGILAIYSEVTEQVLARKIIEENQKDLKQLKEYLEKAVAITKIGFYDWDLIHNKMYYSEQMTKDWGIDSDRTLENAVAFIHPDDRNRFSKEIQEAISDKGIYSSQYRVLRPDGKVTWIEVLGEISYDKTKKPIRFFGTSLNITDRKEAELLLKYEQRKFKEIFHESGSALAIFRGPDLIFDMLNSKFQDLLPHRELLGKPYAEALPEMKNKPFPENMGKVLQTGEPYVSQGEVAPLYNVASGQIEDRYFDSTFTRIADEVDKPSLVICSASDVTDRILSQKRIESNLHELELERELRERFVSALTHDLRTPLTSAKMATQLLLRKGEATDSMKILFTRIIRSMDRADLMIQNLLDANRLKAGDGIPIIIRENELEHLISTVMEDLYEIHGSRFQLTNCTEKLIIFWDLVAIQRVIENLASNAIKYGMVDTPIKIEFRNEDSWIIIEVHNQGDVISFEDQKTLFEPFHRSESAKASDQKGWGIGLGLVREIVKAHGGTVLVKSEIDFGTTFTVRLPLDSRDAK